MNTPPRILSAKRDTVNRVVTVVTDRAVNKTEMADLMARLKNDGWSEDTDHDWRILIAQYRDRQTEATVRSKYFDALLLLAGVVVGLSLSFFVWVIAH